MGNPARIYSLSELPLSVPESDDGPEIDNRQVLICLEQDAYPSQPVAARGGIVLAMVLGAMLWLAILAGFALIT